MVNHRGAAGAISGDHIHHTGGQVERANLREQQGALRSRVRGLQHGGVPGCNRGSKFPHRHVQRVVPRSDLADNADGLPANHGGVIRHVFASASALEVSGRTGKESNLVDTEHDFVVNECGAGLSGVLGLEVRKLIGPLFHLVRNAEECELTLTRCGLPPGLESGLRCRVGSIDICRRGNGRVRVHLLCCRVDELEGILALGLDIGAIDEIL